jgi:hypothetical protein
MLGMGKGTEGEKVSLRQGHYENAPNVTMPTKVRIQNMRTKSKILFTKFPLYLVGLLRH